MARPSVTCLLLSTSLMTSHSVRLQQQTVSEKTGLNADNCTQTYKYDDEAKYIAEMRQAKATDPFIAQMASVANRVYNLASPVAGWELQKSWDLRTDDCSRKYHQNVAIYSRVQKEGEHPTCVLAFAGTRDVIGMFAKLDKPVTDWCGLKNINKGFAERLDAFTKGSRFGEFKSYLSSKKTCGGGLIGVGHSLGGALATLMAACGTGKKWWKMPTLYTFGSPGVSIDGQVMNPLEKNGCFRGARVYTADKWTMDPIPAVGSPLLFEHPRLQEVRIKKLGKHDYAIKQHFCDSDHARERPFAKSKLMILGNGILKHKGQVYVERLLKLHKIYRGDKYGELQNEVEGEPKVVE